MKKKKTIPKKIVEYSVILYARDPTIAIYTPYDDRYTTIYPHNEWDGIQIRARICKGNVSEALDKAKPMKGEIVLNTIPWKK